MKNRIQKTLKQTRKTKAPKEMNPVVRSSGPDFTNKQT